MSREGSLDASIAIHLRKLMTGEILFPGFDLGSAVPQHQMGKIEIEFVRWDVGTFGHEAHVAERAGLNH